MSESNFLPSKNFFMSPNRWKLKQPPCPGSMVAASKLPNCISAIFHELVKVHGDEYCHALVECVDLLLNFQTSTFHLYGPMKILNDDKFDDKLKWAVQMGLFSYLIEL